MEYRIEANQIIVTHALTGHKTKTRLKRAILGHEPIQYASKQIAMADTDYFEWLIGYETASQNDHSVVPEVVLQRGIKQNMVLNLSDLFTK